MKRMLLVVAVVLGACGGGSGAGGAAEPETVSADCAAAVGPFIDALKSLDSRLDVGLTYAEYGDQLGDAKVAYDDVDWKDVGAACVTAVGSDAENALNHYLTAYNT